VSARAIPVDVWIVGALFVLAAVLRFATIASQSYWTDEALTAYEAQLPFGAMVHVFAHVETTPPLYFLLTWTWGHLFGIGETSLRSISTLSGLALVPIAYLAGRELVSRWAGVIAAAFLAVNPFMIWYSQEARAYMLLAALCGASFLFFAYALRDPNRRNLTWWAVFSSLALMTHFFAAFTIAPEAIWLLWVHRTRRVVLAAGAVAAAQAVMIPFAFIDTGHGTQWIALTDKYYRIGQIPLEFGVNTLYRRYTPGQGLLAGAALLVIVWLLLAFAGDRRSRRGAAVAGTIAALTVLVPVGLMYVGQDYFLARNVIAAWLPLAIVVAAACAVPRARILGGALAAVLLAMFLWSVVTIQGDQYLQRPAWRALAHVVGPAPVERGVLVAGGTSSDPIRLYLPRVTWVQPSSRWVWIREIVVIGTRRHLNLLIDGPGSKAVEHGHRPRAQYGQAIPRSISPRGTHLITRFSFKDWVVARWVLRRPMWVNTDRLAAIAPRFFRRTPTALLELLQPPGR
jgi:uncharacterized membrane protein